MAPTLEELAREMAERNDRCGHCADERICLKPTAHVGEHTYEPIRIVIPFH